MSQLWILVLGVVSITTGEFVIAGLLPELATSFDVSVGVAGLAISAYALGMIVGGPLVTAFTARVDRRALLSGLLVVATLGNTAAALAPTFPLLLTTRVVTGLTTATFFAQAIVVAVRPRPPERAARTVATLALGMTVAMVLGAPLGTAVADAWGWRRTFAALAAATLAVCLTLTIRLRLPPEPARASAVAELRVLGRPAVVRALAYTAVGSVGVLMVMSYVAPLLTSVAGFDTGALPALMLAYGIGAALGNVAGGALHDAFPRATPIAVLLGLCIVLGLAWRLADAPWVALGAVILTGALGFALVPGMQAQVLAAASDAPTLAVAVNASGYQCAVAAAGVVGGLIVDSDPLRVYLAAALLSAGALVLAMLTRPDA